MFALLLDEDREKITRFIRENIAHIRPEVKEQSLEMSVVGETLAIKVGSKSAKIFKLGMISHFLL